MTKNLETGFREALGATKNPVTSQEKFPTLINLNQPACNCLLGGRQPQFTGIMVFLNGCLSSNSRTIWGYM